MKPLVLSEKEILNINSFIEEISSISMIEGIYLISFLDRNTGSQHVDIIAIYNSSLNYDVKLTGKEIKRDISNERKQVNAIIQKYKEKYNKKRLSFEIKDSLDYSLDLMYRREIIAEMSLVSGIIIFDRFGDLEDNKRSASRSLPQYSNLLLIENLDMILETQQKNPKLVKKMK